MIKEANRFAGNRGNMRRDPLLISQPGKEKFGFRERWRSGPFSLLVTSESFACYVSELSPSFSFTFRNFPLLRRNFSILSWERERGEKETDRERDRERQQKQQNGILNQGFLTVWWYFGHSSNSFRGFVVGPCAVYLATQ